MCGASGRTDAGTSTVTAAAAAREIQSVSVLVDREEVLAVTRRRNRR